MQKVDDLVRRYEKSSRDGKGGDMYNLESDQHGEWGTNRQIDMLNFERVLPNTEVVANSKVVKERNEEVN